MMYALREERGQMAVELAALMPVILVSLVILWNLARYVSVCVLFDWSLRMQCLPKQLQLEQKMGAWKQFQQRRHPYARRLKMQTISRFRSRQKLLKVRLWPFWASRASCTFAARFPFVPGPGTSSWQESTPRCTSSSCMCAKSWQMPGRQEGRSR